MSAFDQRNTSGVRGRTARLGFAWLAGVLALAVAGAAWAQTGNSIDALTVSKGTSGNTIVKFTLKSPPANPPAGFAIASPPRIALDFLDTGNGLGSSQRTLDDPALRSLNVVQAGNRTRVVFNLNKPQTFATQVEGNTVIVTLFDQSERLDAKAQVVERFAEARPGDVTHALRDVDFRRGQNGEGRIVVDLSDNSTGIDIRQQGRNADRRFHQDQPAAQPRASPRRAGLRHAGHHRRDLQSGRQHADGDRAEGLWEHSAYQTDNRFIIEVKPIQEDPNKLTQGTREGYKGEKLSLNFQNVEVRAVLQVIADFTGLNIITSDTVTGSLTLRLKDIPWDQALDIIMQTKGLDMRKNGNVVLIAPREELAVKEKQQLENAMQISEARAADHRVVPAQLHEGEDFANFLSTNRQQQFGLGAGQTATTGGQGSIISKRGVALVDPRTNILFVSDTAARLEEVRKLHPPARHADPPGHDRGADRHRQRQVQQAARRSLRRADRLHVPKRYAGGQGGSLTTQPVVHLQGDRVVRDTRTQTPFELASGIATAGYSDSPQLNVNLPVINPAGQLALTLINLGSGNLINLELSALEADTRGKVISSPRVVTQDNQKAHIEQGTEIPYVTPGTANNPATVSFKKAVLRLDVTPQITPDNRIIMTVEIRKDSVGQFVDLGGGFRVPSIDTRNVTTQIPVNNGDTAVIGGIFEETITNDVTKVPLLGDIPFLGYLFKTTGRNSREAGAPDLPHAARREGIAEHGEVSAAPRGAQSAKGRRASA